MQFVETLFFGIFLMDLSVEFSLILFGTAKKDCVIKTREIFSFLPLINNSVTIGLTFILLSISAIISSKRINILCSLFGCILHYFYKYHPYHSSIQ